MTESRCFSDIDDITWISQLNEWVFQILSIDWFLIVVLYADKKFVAIYSCMTYIR